MKKIKLISKDELVKRLEKVMNGEKKNFAWRKHPTESGIFIIKELKNER